MDCHDRFANFFHLAGLGHLRGVLHHDDFAVGLQHFIHHAGGGGDQVLIELALQALLHDFHVQQAQKTAAKAKTQRLRHLGFVAQRRIVELEFL